MAEEWFGLVMGLCFAGLVVYFYLQRKQNHKDEKNILNYLKNKKSTSATIGEIARKFNHTGCYIEARLYHLRQRGQVRLRFDLAKNGDDCKGKRRQ